MQQSSDAYGQRLSGNPSSDEFGFGGQAGYRTDPETGLCLLGRRYYDPQAGRFLNRDPAGYAGGMDLYAYCGDDPVNNLDPMGLDYDTNDGSPNTFGGWIDHFAFNDSVANFGTTVGEADAGCATLGDELLAGGKVAGYGALLFVPGGEEARGAEIGANLLDDGARDLAEDAARGCGGGLCLAAGTPVWTPTGEQAVQSVQVGQQVLTRDPQTGKDEVRTVTATVQRPADALVTLSLSDPASGKAETLTCTPEHPLYVQGQGWVEAGDLGVGTQIVTRAGPPLVVQDVRWQRDQTGQHPFTVYNLTVAGDHTYFAGDLEGGLWAHNICRISPVAPDWAVKGAHVLSNGVELAVRPGAGGSIVLKPVFSGEAPGAVDDAIAAAQSALQNPGFRQKLLDRVNQAIPYVRNFPNDGGLGRSGELSFLSKALANF